MVFVLTHLLFIAKYNIEKGMNDLSKVSSPFNKVLKSRAGEHADKTNKKVLHYKKL